MKLNNQELKTIDGGGLTSQMINAVSKIVTTIYELGQATGSALKRIINKKSCPLN